MYLSFFLIFVCLPGCESLATVEPTSHRNACRAAAYAPVRERSGSVSSLSDYPDISKIRTGSISIQILPYWNDGYERSLFDMRWIGSAGGAAERRPVCPGLRLPDPAAGPGDCGAPAQYPTTRGTQRGGTRDQITPPRTATS